jgi:hypothetical protein
LPKAPAFGRVLDQLHLPGCSLDRESRRHIGLDCGQKTRVLLVGDRQMRDDVLEGAPVRRSVGKRVREAWIKFAKGAAGSGPR